MNPAHGQAFAWETWQRGRWWFLIAVLGTSGFVTLFLCGNGFSLADRQFASKSIFPLLMFSETMMFVAYLLQGQGWGPGVVVPRQHYRLPISTRELIAWRVATGVAITTIMHVCVVGIVGWSCGVRFPLVVPILFLALGYISSQAILLFFSGHTGLRIVGGFALGFGLYYWVLILYPSGHRDQWPQIGLIPIFWIVLASIAMFIIAMIGAGNERRGDSGTTAWHLWPWDTFVYHWRSRREAFDSMHSAQLWFERCARGGPTAVLVTAMSLCVLIPMLAMRAEPKDLLAATFGMSLFVLLGGAFPIGMLLGQCRNVNSNFEIDGFRATRPLSDRALAAAMQRSALREVISGWLVFLPVLAIANAIVILGGHREVAALFWREFFNLDSQLSWFIYPLAIVGGIFAHWFLINAGLSFALTGRLALFATFFTTVILAPFTVIITSKDPDFMWLRFAIGYAFLAIFVIGSIWILIAGWRRNYVKGWMAAITIGLVVASLSKYEPVIAAAACALALFTPFASAPLALAWNRHR